MATDNEIMDCIEACRTCGIFYLTTSNILRQIFTSAAVDPEMVLIRMELASWNVEIRENDGFPQFICIGCIHEFNKVFQLRRSCLDMQQQWKHFYDMHEKNKIKIKTEVPDENEEIIRDFIYVDDLSDNEFDGSNSVTPFNISHLPIKEEIIEAAAIPNEPLPLIETFAIEPRFQAADPEQAHEVNSQPELKLVNEQIQLREDIRSLGNVTEYKCDLCPHIAPTQVELREHLQRIHETKDLECHICGKQFKNSSPARVKFHLKWHRISKHIKCAQCGFFCDSRNILKEHRLAKHSKTTCEVCYKKIPTKSMKTHMREHINKLDWDCLYCKEVFNTESERENHIWQVHAKEDEEGRDGHLAAEIICAKCEQKCSSREDLEQHLLDRHQISVVCTEYNDGSELTNNSLNETVNSSVYSEQSAFDETDNSEENNNYSNSSGDVSQAVLNDVTDNIGEDVCNDNVVNRFICAHCTQTFDSIDQLCAHHQEHLKKASFECQVCGKNFDLKFSLNRHLKKHQNTAF